MLDYLWIVIAGGVASFTAAMGIGANEVANAFAASLAPIPIEAKNDEIPPPTKIHR